LFFLQKIATNIFIRDNIGRKQAKT
jgi:hypothetical protein